MLIKYRAFDTVVKKYHFEDELSIFPNGMVERGFSRELYDLQDTNPRFVIELATGLYDKNDHPIYQNDIVKIAIGFNIEPRHFIIKLGEYVTELYNNTPLIHGVGFYMYEINNRTKGAFGFEYGKAFHLTADHVQNRIVSEWEVIGNANLNWDFIKLC